MEVDGRDLESLVDHIGQVFRFFTLDNTRNSPKLNSKREPQNQRRQRIRIGVNQYSTPNMASAVGVLITVTKTELQKCATVH